MKFGVREIADVVLRAKSKQKVGKRTFYRNDPVIYFDSLTTSSLEGAATTNYATGSRGAVRLVGWEGERTLTFNMTDALISPESFMILSGAGLIDADSSADVNSDAHVLYIHTTSQVQTTEANYVIIPKVACWSHSGEMAEGYYHDGADIFVMVLNNGEIDGEPRVPAAGGVAHGTMVNGVFTPISGSTVPTHTRIEVTNSEDASSTKAIPAGSVVLVDYYVKRTSGAKQIEILPDKFGGYYYLEGSTLWRREADGVDVPAEIVIPKVKIQSNFTFTMAPNGDPSTFDFVMDAFPDYTKFDPTKKVLAILQVLDGEEGDEEGLNERRHHSVQAEDTAASVEASEFDHWKTYGEQNTFGVLQSNGSYKGSTYPKTEDTEPNKAIKPEL